MWGGEEQELPMPDSGVQRKTIGTTPDGRPIFDMSGPVPLKTKRRVRWFSILFLLVFILAVGGGFALLVVRMYADPYRIARTTSLKSVTHYVHGQRFDIPEAYFPYFGDQIGKTLTLDHNIIFLEAALPDISPYNGDKHRGQTYMVLGPWLRLRPDHRTRNYPRRNDYVSRHQGRMDRRVD